MYSMMAIDSNITRSPSSRVGTLPVGVAWEKGVVAVIAGMVRSRYGTPSSSRSQNTRTDRLKGA
jgi:hypothetical protein